MTSKDKLIEVKGEIRKILNKILPISHQVI